MAKRASLSSMVKAAAAAPTPVPAKRRAPKPKAEPGEATPEGTKPEGGSRAGRAVLGSYQTAETIKQTKLLATEQDTTMQALMAEALNLLFQKYGKPTIAKP